MPGPGAPPIDSHAAESSEHIAAEPGIPGASEDSHSISSRDGLFSDIQRSRFDSYAELPPAPADVWLHVYHCDPYTGFLNQAFLNRNDVGIYHCGVEVYSYEWSFQYFEDTWDDPSVSGIIRCSPRQMDGYDYQETVHLGVTSLSEEEVEKELERLKEEWPACSYHLTRNNCLVFAEHFAGILRVPEPFPSRLKGILEASAQNQRLDAVVDYGWSWSKWWMLRKHGRPLPRAEPDVGEHQSAGGLLWLAAVLNPTQACSTTPCLRSVTRCASEEHCVNGPAETSTSLPAG